MIVKVWVGLIRAAVFRHTFCFTNKGKIEVTLFFFKGRFFC